MRSRVPVVFLSLALALGLMVPLASAQPATSAGTFRRVSLDGIDAKLQPAMADPTRMVTVMLQMEAAPVARVAAAAAEEGEELSNAQRRVIRRSLRAQQDRITDDITALGGRVLSQLQDAYNGVKVRVASGQLPELARLEGVRAVRPLEEHRPTNTDSVRFIGAPGAWERPGATGKDTSIAIIDTGIDYTHADFGGSGDPAAFEANNPEVIEPGSFRTDKVVGGWDFVGDDYNASSDDPEVNTPDPDPDPLDCHGHGTHVAGTAAGTGVTADGETFRGPYDRATFRRTRFHVGPGVAPEADLYALRVFGCEGSTNVTVDAINWAVANRVDVINMSLGAPFGRADDPSSVAANNAALAGVVVVISAGNSGASPYILGAPAAGTGAISVAAVDTIATIPQAAVVAGDTTIAMQNSNDAEIPEQGITGPVVVLTDDPATADVDESLGCLASDYEGVNPGDIVVTLRGACPRVDRAILAQQAGAAAVIMINTDDEFPPFEGPIPGVTIPFLGARASDADAIRALAGQTVTINPADPIPNPTFRQLAGFTSAGPLQGTDAAKPDISGPGVGIASALVGSGTQSQRLSGTSMAAPHVAGVAALVRQQRRDWPVDAVKAAIVNTGRPGQIANYSTTLAGSGMVHAPRAVRTPVVALGDPLTASLSFGYLESSGTIEMTKRVRVWNYGDEPAMFRVGTDLSTNAGNAASVSVNRREITVEPESARAVKVTLRINARRVPRDEVGIQTVSGNVALRPVGAGPQGQTYLRVPFVAVPRAVSDLETTPDDVVLPEGANFVAFTTENRSPVPGRADVFAWGLSDEAGESTITDLRAAGVQAFPAEGEDTPGEDDDVPAMGAFAINSTTRASNPAATEWDVLLDVDEDGEPDYGVIGADLGAVLIGGSNGVLASFTVDLDDFSIVNAFFAEGGLNTSTVVLPFELGDVGLDAESNPDFRYAAGVFLPDPDDELGGTDDVFDADASFNAFDQPIETGQSFEVPGNGSVQWRSTVDRESLAENPVLGWMVVYLDNPAGEESADLIGLRLAP